MLSQDDVAQLRGLQQRSFADPSTWRRFLRSRVTGKSSIGCDDVQGDPAEKAAAQALDNESAHLQVNTHVLFVSVVATIKLWTALIENH